MKISAQSQAQIELIIKQAVSQFEGYTEGTIVTDIHLLPRQETGELCIFNDDDEELAKVIISEWTENESEHFIQNVEHILQNTLNKLKEEGVFDHLLLMKPYSFVLVDEDGETIKDLMLMDDDVMIFDDSLLKGLDEELDDFLKNLLNEK